MEKIKVSSAAILLGSYRVSPAALRKTKIVYNFDLSECSRVKHRFF